MNEQQQKKFLGMLDRAFALRLESQQLYTAAIEYAAEHGSVNKQILRAARIGQGRAEVVLNQHRSGQEYFTPAEMTAAYTNPSEEK